MGWWGSIPGSSSGSGSGSSLRRITAERCGAWEYDSAFTGYSSSKGLSPSLSIPLSPILSGLSGNVSPCSSISYKRLRVLQG